MHGRWLTPSNFSRRARGHSRDCAPFACRHATSSGRLKLRRRRRAHEQAARAHVRQTFRGRPHRSRAAASAAAASARAAPLVLLHAPAFAQVYRGYGGRACALLLPLGKASGRHQWQPPMWKSSLRRLRSAGFPEASVSSSRSRLGLPEASASPGQAGAWAALAPRPYRARSRHRRRHGSNRPSLLIRRPLAPR